MPGPDIPLFSVAGLDCGTTGPEIGFTRIRQVYAEKFLARKANSFAHYLMTVIGHQQGLAVLDGAADVRLPIVVHDDLLS
jgi:hypothetical protein